MITIDSSTLNFIGIGAHKGGTTWLHKNLNYHPDIWLPPKKELHYFDRSTKYPSPSLLCCSRTLLKRFIDQDSTNKKYREHLAKAIYLFSQNPSWQDLRWYQSYYFGEHNDEWYLSLFQDSNCSAKGEITPSYSMMEEVDVEKVYRLVPNAKIIFLLRHPIDRAWSALRYRKKRKYKHQGLTSRPVPELVKAIENNSFELRSNYLRTLRAWQKYFPNEQIFIGFYDEIIKSPIDLLLRIFEFLEVETSTNHIAPSILKRVNASPQEPIPDELKHFLAEKYYGQIQTLSQELGKFTTDWLADLEQILTQYRERSSSLR